MLNCSQSSKASEEVGNYMTFPMIAATGICQIHLIIAAFCYGIRLKTEKQRLARKMCCVHDPGLL